MTEAGGQLLSALCSTERLAPSDETRKLSHKGTKVLPSRVTSTTTQSRESLFGNSPSASTGGTFRGGGSVDPALISTVSPDGNTAGNAVVKASIILDRKC